MSNFENRVKQYSCCSCTVNKFINIFGMTDFNNIVESVGLQAVSCYHTLVLFNKDLTFYDYLESYKYNKMITMVIKAILNGLKIKLKPNDMKDFNSLIKVYAMNIVRYNSRYDAILVLEYE